MRWRKPIEEYNILDRLISRFYDNISNSIERHPGIGAAFILICMGLICYLFDQAGYWWELFKHRNFIDFGYPNSIIPYLLILGAGLFIFGYYLGAKDGKATGSSSDSYKYHSPDSSASLEQHPQD